MIGVLIKFTCFLVFTQSECYFFVPNHIVPMNYVKMK